MPVAIPAPSIPFAQRKTEQGGVAEAGIVCNGNHPKASESSLHTSG